MKKIIIVTLLFAACAYIAFKKDLFNSHKNTTAQSKKIGIIIPLTHPAMQKIVNGFCEKMNHISHHVYSFIIRDAHGDQAIQQPAIIDEMIHEKVDLIVPIGTLCTQMTAQKVSDIPIIGLASSKKCTEIGNNAYAFTDEVAANQHIAFITEIIPNIDKIAIIATQNEKTIPEVEEFRKAAMNNGISVQIIYIQNTSELYLATNSIDDDAQAIFIFKDHQVVSGITTLVHYAEEHKIPLISSDEGSVEQGASCALGVEESTTGEEGAILAYRLLTTGFLDRDSIKDLSKFAIFINQKHAKLQHVNITAVKNFCTKKNCPYKSKG